MSKCSNCSKKIKTSKSGYCKSCINRRNGNALIMRSRSKPWTKKHHHSIEAKERIAVGVSIALKGKPFSAKHKRNISRGSKGKKLSLEHKRKLSETKIGERHWNWQNGKSFEPYGLEFNGDLKEVIRNRDKRRCFICGKIQIKDKRKLSIHHIDYNKKNNNPNNLISLCLSCHIKTNYKRDTWIKYFSEKGIFIERL